MKMMAHHQFHFPFIVISSVGSLVGIYFLSFYAG